MTTKESQRPTRINSAVAIILPAIILIGFFMAIAGFFMTWAGEQTTSHEILPGQSAKVKITSPVMTGKDAEPYGYATLGLGIIGLALVLIRLAFKKFPSSPFITIGILGILNLTLILRSNPKVTAFGSVGYAIRHGDWTLGYTPGPGIALIGFTLAVIAGAVWSMLVTRKS